MRFVAAILALGVAPCALAGSGTDWSVNVPAITGMTLLRTIPYRFNRLQIELQARCAAGVSVVLDDAEGEQPGTILQTAGSGGGYFSYAHTGRVRVYSTDANCPVAIREWP